MMRALTVRQPWAWAIVHGGKDVENRSRNIAGTYRGPVAIHAGLAFDTDYDLSLLARLVPTWDAPVTTFDPWQHRPDGVRGAVIGVADLTDAHVSIDCWNPSEQKDDHCSPWAMPGHHLVLANPRPLARPIPWRGALGLWTVPDELEARIWEQVTA